MPERDQETAPGGEGARTQRQARRTSLPGRQRRGGGEPVAEADDRLAPGIAAEQQEEEQYQQRYKGQQKGAKLGHA